MNGPFSCRSGMDPNNAKFKIQKCKMRILIVDDEPALSDHLARTLGDAGYAVDVAADGEKAVGRLAQRHYDAIVLDIALPKLSGTDVMEWMAARRLVNRKSPSRARRWAHATRRKHTAVR